MAVEDIPAMRGKPPKRPASPLKRAWRRVRKPLANSTVARNVLASAIANFLRLVKATNRVAEGSDSIDALFDRHPVMIVAIWHGQHISLPAFFPKRRNMVALISKSADADMNAAVAERMGIAAVRGSGGRDREKSLEKGGARALIALKKALADGKDVTMIADIPHGTPREAGMGVVALAKMSGRPLICGALATSRRKVFERSWDKTTINLPFGQVGIAIADPIFVPPDATDEQMEEYRVLVTRTLNRSTERAYRLADGAS